MMFFDLKTVIFAVFASALALVDYRAAADAAIKPGSHALGDDQWHAIEVTRKDGKWIYYVLSANAAPIAKSLLLYFADTINDKRIRRDAARVQQRLKLREDGCCNLGFNQLK